MTDPITDMFNRIKNAQAAGHSRIFVPVSKLKLAIIEILKRERFIEDFTKKGRANLKNIEISLRYEDKTPVVSGFKRISKPGQRIYAGKKKIHKIKKSYGIVIISTSQGLMTEKEARKKGLGGEILVEVW